MQYTAKETDNLLNLMQYAAKETDNLLNLMQYAAKETTPKRDPQRTTNNINYEIKKLVAERRRANSMWQTSHIPDSRRT